jgi:xanthine dehydrogenase YagS FAD-binding subunit
MVYELPRFEHIDARDVKHAVTCLQTFRGKAKVIAGGTDLLALMKDRIEGPNLMSPDILVNIKTIPETTHIAYDKATGLSIGTAVTLHRIQTCEVIREKFSLLSQAAGEVGTTQIRNRGTLGGNICQRPRCAYFRHPHFVCFKKGGACCYAASGEHRFYHSIIKNGRCVMAHPSDIAPALVALKARAVIVGPGGERRILLKDFFSGPDRTGETILRSDEFLLAAEIPDQPGEARQVFLKHRIRRSGDFALASVAVVARISDEGRREISIVLGGIAPFPRVAAAAEEIIRDRGLNDRVISEAAEAAVEGARPLPMNRYKLDLTKALVKRGLMAIINH